MAIRVLVPSCAVKTFSLVDKVEPFDFLKENPDYKGDNDWVIVTFATGRVVNLREMNGSYDSDFYAEYMTEDGTFREFEYASTRGWTYANGATIDATPEVQAAYLAYHNKMAHDRMLAHEQHLDEMALKAKVSRAEFDKLRTTYHGDAFAAVYKLLSTNLRSDFRKSLAQRVREWLADPAPKYRTPLSITQLRYL